MSIAIDRRIIVLHRIAGLHLLIKWQRRLVQIQDHAGGGGNTNDQANKHPDQRTASGFFLRRGGLARFHITTHNAFSLHRFRAAHTQNSQSITNHLPHRHRQGDARLFQCRIINQHALGVVPAVEFAGQIL